MLLKKNNKMRFKKAQLNFFVLWFLFPFILNYTLIPASIVAGLQVIFIILVCGLFVIRVRNGGHLLLVFVMLGMIFLQYLLSLDLFCAIKIFGIFLVSVVLLTYELKDLFIIFKGYLKFSL